MTVHPARAGGVTVRLIGGHRGMDFGEAIRVCFSKYAVFGGRARRSEYWFFVLFAALVRFGAGILDAGIMATSQWRGVNVFTTVVALALFLPQLAAQVRRLHDTGRSGFWILGFFGYVVAALIVFFSLFGLHPGSGGTSGGVLVVLILIGAAYGIGLLVMMILPGTHGENRYGPDPLGPDVSVFS